jgi:hypothetical protein
MDSRRSLRERAFVFGVGAIQMAPAVRRFGVDFGNVADQLSRSATAVGALLEEAVVSQSRRDMAYKHVLALREAREAEYWLRLLTASRFADPNLSPLKQEAGELCAMLTASVRRLKKPPVTC